MAFIYGQSPYSAEFGQLTVPAKDSVVVTIQNSLKKAISYTALPNLNKEFTVNPRQITLPAKGSANIVVRYVPVNNVKASDVIVFLSPDSSKSFVILVKGTAIYNDGYQATTFDKYDSSLFAALTPLATAGHHALGYNTGRDSMFMKIDILPGDSIECVYTGARVHLTSRVDAQNQGFNTEHTWPQSFFGSADPMVSDINHLYPTLETPNGRRSNYPFGIVVPSTVTYSDNGSMLGKNIYNAICFEPRDVHKGNVSRSILYFMIRYPINYGGYFDTVQESTFRLWNRFDTVDARERARCNGIQRAQGNRNPLIDHPEFVDRIYSFFYNKVNRPVAPLFEVYPPRLSLDTVAVGDTASLPLNLFNLGNGESTVTSMSFVSGKFLFTNVLGTIPVKGVKLSSITFIPTTAGFVVDTLKIVADGRNYFIPVSAMGGVSSTVSKDISVSAGWNILSAALNSSTPVVGSVFPGANSLAYGYDNGYYSFDTLKVGIGFWLRYAAPATITITGMPSAENTIPLLQGWNLVGCQISDLTVATISTTPPGIINSLFYGFESGYSTPAILKSGKGYWVRASANGTMNTTNPVAKGNAISLSAIEKDWAKITITDRLGRSATLYSAKKGVNLSSFDLPPMPPAGNFDVRFSTARFVETLESETKSIILSDVEYPVEIRAEGIELRVWDKATNGNIFSTVLKSGNHTIINKPKVNVVEVQSIANPVSFGLSQNYPNPFNPETVIKYSVPTGSFVSLRVYDMLGREVVTLVNNYLAPGFYETAFSASHLSSGVYLYELRAGNSSILKKMTVLK